jgi:membrane-associated protein
VLARFVPIVRTFAPIVAGAAEMTYRNFIIYNVFGGLLWVASMLLAGYFLGGLVEQFVRNVFGIEGFLLEDHIDKVVIVVVFLSILPIIFEFIKARRENKLEAAAASAETEAEKAV